MLQANRRIIEFLFWLRNLWSHQSANEDEWIVTNIFLQFFENSSDELGTGNTRHFRKSIVNDESDER
jgi:hypothetical protein